MTPDELEKFGMDSRGERDRDRIGVLAQHFARIARGLEAQQKRVAAVIRIIEVALVIFMVVAIAGYVALRAQSRATDRAANRAEAVAAEQTVARYRSVYAACIERGRINDGIVHYLIRRGAVRKQVAEAREFFPQQPPCRKYTIELLGSPAPEGAFELPEVLKRRVDP
jgi:hypothetical protein